MTNPRPALRALVAVVSLLAGALALAPAATAATSSYLVVSGPTTGQQVLYGRTAKVTATLRVNAKTVRRYVPVGLYKTPSTRYPIATGKTDRYGRVSFSVKPTASQRVWFYAKAYGGYPATKFAWARLDEVYQPIVSFSVTPSAILDNGDPVTMSATVTLNGRARRGTVVDAIGSGGTSFVLGTSDAYGKVKGVYPGAVEWLTQNYQAVTRATSRCWKDAWGTLCDKVLSARSTSTPTLTVEHPLTIDGSYTLVPDKNLVDPGQTVTFTATVIQSNSAPWPNLQVRAMGGGTPVWTGYTNAQGVATFSVAPTRNTTYFLEPYGRYAAYSTFTDPEWVVVTVTKGHYTYAVTTIKPSYGVDDAIDGALDLTPVNGAPLSGVPVVVSGPDGEVASGTTDANGHFAFHDTTTYQLGQITYAAEVDHGSPEYVFDSGTDATVSVTPTRLDYQLSATPNSVTAGGTVTINGTVNRSNGAAPYTGTVVLCGTPEGTIPGSVLDCLYSASVQVTDGAFTATPTVDVDAGTSEVFQLVGDSVSGPVYETTQDVTVAALAP